MFRVNTRGIQTPNFVGSMAIFAGGLLQFIASMWEFLRGSVFGATRRLSTKNNFIVGCCFLLLYKANPEPSWCVRSVKDFFSDWLSHIAAFSAYGTFWMSYATIFIPGSGILAAYGNYQTLLVCLIHVYCDAHARIRAVFLWLSHHRRRSL
jgi:succinate-acetate transporter protein